MNSCVTRCAVIYSTFSQIRLRIKELSLSDDATSCVPSNRESKENRVNTDAFATCENVQIQTQQIPAPPRFSAFEVYELLQKTNAIGMRAARVYVMSERCFRSSSTPVCGNSTPVCSSSTPVVDSQLRAPKRTSRRLDALASLSTFIGRPKVYAIQLGSCKAMTRGFNIQ